MKCNRIGGYYPFFFQQNGFLVNASSRIRSTDTWHNPLIPSIFLFEKWKYSLSLDLFSTVLFIVAGPAIGFTLWQFYFHVDSLINYLTGRGDRKYEFSREYSNLRPKCNEKERAELETLDARQYFGMSTGMALSIISVLFALVHVSSLGKVNSPVWLTIYSILAVAIILIIGAAMDNKRVRIPFICQLMRKYKLPLTNACSACASGLYLKAKNKAKDKEDANAEAQVLGYLIAAIRIDERYFDKGKQELKQVTEDNQVKIKEVLSNESS
jgi:amino acid transporter